MKREMKMVKRTLIAIAVVALLATSLQAALGPEPHYGTRVQDGQHTGIKVNPEDMTIGWPFEYVALDLCTIPVKMEIGYYVEVHKCNELQIKLVQVDCADLVKHANETWPCYQDCTDVTIRSNFEVKLGLNKAKIGNVLDAWDAYIKGDVATVGPGEDTITICVEAWKARLFESDAAAGSVVNVGTVTITVKPAV